jgi:hypothetical protein
MLGTRCHCAQRRQEAYPTRASEGNALQSTLEEEGRDLISGAFGRTAVPLPIALVDEIRAVSSAQSVDADEAIRALSVLLADDECFAYTVWGGPGYGQESVRLDVYVVGKFALYNYTVLEENKTTRSCLFWDAVSQVSLLDVTDSRSPHILAVWTNQGERSRVFGAPQDLRRLENLQHSIVVARGERR